MARRENVDRSPGKTGGTTYVRRDAEAKSADDHSELGKSTSDDMRIDAAHEAPKGQKERGD
jgi:hypothetical protein